jgi:hypothetical protein
MDALKKLQGAADLEGLETSGSSVLIFLRIGREIGQRDALDVPPVRLEIIATSRQN